MFRINCLVFVAILLISGCVQKGASRGRQPHKAGCDTCPSLSNEGKIDKPGSPKKKK